MSTCVVKRCLSADGQRRSESRSRGRLICRRDLACPPGDRAGEEDTSLIVDDCKSSFTSPATASRAQARLKKDRSRNHFPGSGSSNILISVTQQPRLTSSHNTGVSVFAASDSSTENTHRPACTRTAAPTIQPKSARTACARKSTTACFVRER